MALYVRNGGSIYTGMVAPSRRTDGSIEPGIFTEIVYSIQHKKLLELAGKAGAIYRIDGTVLINRDIFEDYLEQFREKSTLLGKEEK